MSAPTSSQHDTVVVVRVHSHVTVGKQNLQQLAYVVHEQPNSHTLSCMQLEFPWGFVQQMH